MQKTDVVAIGGGHGLAATLRALKSLPVTTTAVVTVADDGGSTGRLRADSRRAAPGDIRRCMLALADRPTPLGRAMEHRFDAGEMDGHAFGNLLIAAMEESEGSLVDALDEIGHLISVAGRVLPATEEYVELVARLGGGDEIVGQAEIAQTPGIESVEVRPAAPACGAAVSAIESADVVLLGPGSLYTSVLAAVMVPGIVQAIGASDSRVVYISNLRPQPHETAGYSLVDHVAALCSHGVTVDEVLSDPQWIGAAKGLSEVVGGGSCPVIHEVGLADHRGLVHDQQKLRDALATILS